MLAAEDLSFVADALLALCEDEGEAPAYGEEVFRHKLRLSRLRDPVAGLALLDFAPDPLRWSEVAELIVKARLTARQRDALFLRLDGFDFEGVGQLLGSSRQSIRKTILSAIVKVRRSKRDYPYAGLADVYRSETRRGKRRR